MFIWTIIILATHIFVTVKQFTIPGTEKLISDVPAGLLILMGVSNGAYLGMKAADAKAEAPSINPDQNAG